MDLKAKLSTRSTIAFTKINLAGRDQKRERLLPNLSRSPPSPLRFPKTSPPSLHEKSPRFQFRFLPSDTVPPRRGAVFCRPGRKTEFALIPSRGHAYVYFLQGFVEVAIELPTFFKVANDENPEIPRSTFSRLADSAFPLARRRLFFRRRRRGRKRRLVRPDGRRRFGGGIPAPDFTDNSDDTVTDNNTRLVWRKTDDGVTRSWADASSYCNNLNFAGRTDWRLPGSLELLSVTDYSKASPAAPSALGMRSSGYWSSTAYVGNANRAWDVIFDGGDSNNNLKTDSRHARCVSGVASTLTYESLTLEGQPAFRVRGTGLTFAGTDDGVNRNWADAVSHCANLTYGGRSDWRMPTLKELQLLLDHSRENPAAPSVTGFTDASTFYWSSTANVANDARAWLVYFRDGYTSWTEKNRERNVRCVSS